MFRKQNTRGGALLHVLRYLFCVILQPIKCNVEVTRNIHTFFIWNSNCILFLHLHWGTRHLFPTLVQTGQDVDGMVRATLCIEVNINTSLCNENTAAASPGSGLLTAEAEEGTTAGMRENQHFITGMERKKRRKGAPSGAWKTHFNERRQRPRCLWTIWTRKSPHKSHHSSNYTYNFALFFTLH